MNLIRILIILFLCVWTFSASDPEVLCVFMKSCMLPCGFQRGDETIIHWFKVSAGERVHSFYSNQDQLGEQNQNFSSRTSLFRDQISRGNASLLLRGVKVQDEGEYRCVTSTTSGYMESFINIQVNAPVSQVNFYKVENSITCSSEGIYPKPNLTWSAIPSLNTSLQTRTTVHQTEQQLYSISSSLMVPNGGSGLIYSCTIRDGNRVTSTFLPSVNVTNSEASISCSASNTSVTHLVWRFNLSHIILNQSRTEVSVSEEWRKHVKEVSESGSLTLHHLSSNHRGTYTCDVTHGEETTRTNVFLRIPEDNGAKVTWILGTVGAVLVLAAAALLVFYWKHKQAETSQ